MKFTIWFFILILNLIITLQKHADASTHLFRKAKQCKGGEMPCARESDCCSGVCQLLVLDSSEEDTPEKLCGCSRDSYPCLETDDCCDSEAVCRNKKCHIVKDSNCGKACTKGSDCFTCPFCNNGICSKSTAKCDEPCPSGSNYECIRGALCRNKICKCSNASCKTTNTRCNSGSECCKKACERVGPGGSTGVCA